MNYLFSQNYNITILQAEKSVRYNRSSIYSGSKGVIKCNNYLGQQGITIGVWCYGIVSHTKEFGTKQFLRVMYIVLSEFTVQDLGEQNTFIPWNNFNNFLH